MISLTGCTNYLPFQGDEDDPQGDEDTPGSELGETDSKWTQRFDQSIESDRILLSPESVPNGFEFFEDNLLTLDEAVGEEQSEMQERGLLLQHSRTFLGEEGTRQEEGHLASELEVYESVEQAAEQKESHTDTFLSAYEGEIKETILNHPIDTTVITASQSDNHKQYIINGQGSNLLLRVLIMGDIEQSTLENLYSRMVISIN